MRVTLDWLLNSGGTIRLPTSPWRESVTFKVNWDVWFVRLIIIAGILSTVLNGVGGEGENDSVSFAEKESGKTDDEEAVSEIDGRACFDCETVSVK